MRNPPQRLPKNPLLVLLEKMSKERNQSLEEFANFLNYGRTHIQVLKDHPWFLPSQTTLNLFSENMEFSDGELDEFYCLPFLNVDLEPEKGRDELLKLYDLLPSDDQDLIVQTSRQLLEQHCCTLESRHPNPLEDTYY